MTFFFYSKSDTTKEPIKKIECLDIRRAVVIFAGMKQLTIDDFLILYNVEAIK